MEMTHREAIERLSNLYRVIVLDGLGEYNDNVRHNAAIDLAIKALKAQEPELVTNIRKEHNNVLNPNVPWVGKCPKCGKKIEGRNLTRFCKFCGQAVKWR